MLELFENVTGVRFFETQCSSKGTPPKFGWNGCGVAVFSRKLAISLKWGKIGPTLLLLTEVAYAFSIGTKVNDIG